MSKDKPKPAHPHDAIFKEMMSRDYVAREFFEFYLPPSMLEQVNLSTLRRQSPAMVDSALRTRQVDILYQVEFVSGEGYLVLFVEHQRRSEAKMFIRILKYVIGLLEYHIKQHKTNNMPIIFPMVFYNGETKPNFILDPRQWYPKEHAKLWMQQFCGPYELIDVNQVSDVDLAKQQTAGLLSLAMKSAGRKHFSEHMQTIVPLLQDTVEKYGERSILSVEQYLSQTSSMTTQEYRALIKKYQQKDKPMMSTYDQFVAEGRAEGRAQGITQGITRGVAQAATAFAERLRQRGFDEATIEELTEVELEKDHVD